MTAVASLLPDLAGLLARVCPPDESAMAAAVARHLELTKPAGALGRLEELGVRLAGVQGRCPPEPLRRRRLVVFAGDHGVTARGVSAYPAEVTAQMVANMLAGGAACSVLAAGAGVGVRVLDVAVATDVPGAPPDVARHKVRRGSGSIDVEPALAPEECAAAFAAGVAVADEEVDAGADLLIAGDMGIGNTTIAAALTCAFTGAEPADVVGRGTGVDAAGWARKTAVVADALRRTRPAGRPPLDVLAELGGADFAAITGFLVGAAARRTPVVLDGVVPTVSALAAVALAPSAVGCLVAGHRSTEPAQQRALERLGLRPLLDLELRLGEGTGALLAVPLLDQAVTVLRDTATFTTAGVARS